MTGDGAGAGTGIAAEAGKGVPFRNWRARPAPGPVAGWKEDGGALLVHASPGSLIDAGVICLGVGRTGNDEGPIGGG